MLKIKDLYVNYGGIKALKGININVPDGKIITLIGGNGAGKSTALRTAIGLVKPASGTILYDDQDLTNVKTKDIVSRGLVLVPEGRKVFSNLTIHENLVLGSYARKDKAEIERDREKVISLFPRLGERLKQKAGTLSGGEQQMLAVGRAIMTKPNW